MCVCGGGEGGRLGVARRAGGLSNFLPLDVFSLRKSIPTVIFFLNPDSLKSLVHFLL